MACGIKCLCFFEPFGGIFPPKMIQKNIPKKNDISFCLLPQMQMPQIPIKELAVLYPLHQGPVVKNGFHLPRRGPITRRCASKAGGSGHRKERLCAGAPAPRQLKAIWLWINTYRYSLLLGDWTSINPSYFDVNYRATWFWPIPIYIYNIYTHKHTRTYVYCFVDFRTPGNATRVACAWWCWCWSCALPPRAYDAVVFRTYGGIEPSASDDHGNKKAVDTLRFVEAGSPYFLLPVI